MKRTNKLLIYLFVLVSSVLFVYWQAFDNPVIFDSLAIELPVKDNLGAKHYAQMWADYFLNQINFNFDLNRNFLKDTFGLLSSQFGFGVYEHTILNVVLHTVNAFLLFVFLRFFYSQTTSIITSLFFALNPAAIYAVAYLIQRSQLLMLFFGLLQGIFYLSALKSRFWLSPFLFLLSLFCLKMAFVSKEHGIVLLALYPLLSIAFKEKRSLLYLSPLLFFGLSLVPKILSKITISNETEYYLGLILNTCSFSGDLYFTSILTQCGLFFHYFLHWVLPLPASIDMKFEFHSSVAPLVCIVFYLSCAISFLFRQSTRFLGVGLVLSLCLFATEFARIRLGEAFVLYRSYLWAVGYMIAIGWVIERVKRKIIFVPILLGLLFVTNHQLKFFDSEVKAWTNATNMIDLENKEISCQGARSFNNAGLAFVKEEKYRESSEYIKTAVQLNPGWMTAASNLGSVYYLLGDLNRAEDTFKKILNQKSFNTEPESLIPNAQMMLKMIQEIKSQSLNKPQK